MKFSVLISVYEKDNPQYFKIALESVFEQTVTPTEVVLVVDGPIPKETSQVIQTMEKMYENLNVIYLKQNLGHGGSRSKGLKNCSYELVAVMDSDDISVPDRFEKQLKCFENDKGVSVIGGYIKEFEGDVEHVIGLRKVPLEDGEIKQYLKTRCPVNFVTTMFKKSHVNEVGGFIDWYCEEDYYLWVRMCLAGYKFKNIPDCLVHVRMNPDSYMRRGGLRYFKSEASLQKYMYDNRIISLTRLIFNVSIRFVVQVLITNSLRGVLFKTVFRSKKG